MRPGAILSLRTTDASTATNNGMLVLGTAGVQSETDLPFAGLHQLLRPILDRLRGLPPVQRDAVRVTLVRTRKLQRLRLLLDLELKTRE